MILNFFKEEEDDTMIDTKRRLMRLIRLVAYPEDHTAIVTVVSSGLLTTKLETTQALKELHDDGEIFMDRKDIYLLKKKAA